MNTSIFNSSTEKTLSVLLFLEGVGGGGFLPEVVLGYNVWFGVPASDKDGVKGAPCSPPLAAENRKGYTWGSVTTSPSSSNSSALSGENR